MYIRICIHIATHIHKYIHISLSLSIYIYIYVCIYTYIYIYIYHLFIYTIICIGTGIALVYTQHYMRCHGMRAAYTQLTEEDSGKSGVATQAEWPYMRTFTPSYASVSALALFILPDKSLDPDS